MDGVEMVEMTEQKRRIISLDQHDSQNTSPPKRHKSSSTEISLSAKERKERIGERITALQQLVSPFGKTDTASVLTDAMEYIKFLQDQVKLLSAPYLQNTSGKVQESEQYNLRSRGLCLMPISCTLRVARSNGADLWAPIKVNSPKM